MTPESGDNGYPVRLLRRLVAIDPFVADECHWCAAHRGRRVAHELPLHDGTCPWIAATAFLTELDAP